MLVRSGMYPPKLSLKPMGSPGLWLDQAHLCDALKPRSIPPSSSACSYKMMLPAWQKMGSVSLHPQGFLKQGFWSSGSS